MGCRGLTVDRYGGALVAAIYDDDGRLPPRPMPGALAEMLAEATGTAQHLRRSTGRGRRPHPR